MRYQPVTPPAVEPVSLAEAKAHLRLETDADDPTVSGMLAAAREWVESRAHVALVTQTYDIYLDAWDNRPWSNLTGYVGWAARAGTTIYNDAHKSNMVRLPVGPVQRVDSVTFTGAAGETGVWDASQYVVSLGQPGRLAPKQGACFPAVASQIDAVKIRVVAGYGDAAAGVPERAKCAVKIVLAWLYENRAPAEAELLAVDNLLASLGCGANLFA